MAEDRQNLKRNWIPLAVSTTLFLAWLSWLGYQAYYHAYPVVVSRSQSAVAAYAVVAELSFQEDGRPQREAMITEVFGQHPDRESLRGQKLVVKNLPETQFPPRHTPHEQNKYLLFLERVGDEFRVVTPPRSPGYEIMSKRPLIYPWTNEVRKQLEQQLADS